MGAYSTLSDQHLLQLLKESDHAAYTEIYNRYFYLIFTHAYKKLRDEEQAKDVVHDVFASLWFKREFNLPNTNLAGYLFTAVRNKIFDLFARQVVKGKYIESLKSYISNQTNAPTDYLLRERELNDYIEKSIQSLPLKMKQVFEMSRKENLSYQEIARQLGVTENNVSKQVNNALRILKTKLGAIIVIAALLIK